MRPPPDLWQTPVFYERGFCITSPPSLDGKKCRVEKVPPNGDENAPISKNNPDDANKNKNGNRPLISRSSSSTYSCTDCNTTALSYATLIETKSTILAEGTGMGHLVRQRESQKPTVSHVDFNLTHQALFATNSEQVPDEKHLEQDHRINGRTTVIRTAQFFDLFVDEVEIDGLVDFSQKVIFGNKLPDTDQFDFTLLLQFAFDHARIIQSPGFWARTLSRV